MTNALVQTRIDPDIRDRAAAVLESMGLTVSDAVRILLTRTANEGALPIELLSDPAVHDAWFRAKVREALEDVRDDVEDDAVEKLTDVQKVPSSVTARSDVWLRVDEREDVLGSLEACKTFLEDLQSKPLNWKYLVICLHNALQGALVCHLNGTAGVGALDQRSVDRQLEWHERDRERHIAGKPKNISDPFPSSRLADMKTLFSRVQTRDEMTELGAGQPIEISAGEKRAFELLHELRNRFVHFEPAGWSIELAGLPRMAVEIVTLIGRIAADPWPFWHLPDERRVHLKNLIESLRTDFSALEN